MIVPGFLDVNTPMNEYQAYKWDTKGHCENYPKNGTPFDAVPTWAWVTGGVGLTAPAIGGKGKVRWGCSSHSWQILNSGDLKLINSADLALAL